MAHREILELGRAAVGVKHHLIPTLAAIGRRRAALVLELKQAVKAGDLKRTFCLAAKLTGEEDTGKLKQFTATGTK